jgi:acyl carrier protein
MGEIPERIRDGGHRYAGSNPALSRQPEGKLLSGGTMMIFEKLKNLIIEQVGADSEEVTQEASFIDDLGLDSLDIVELIMAAEEEFDIEISDEDAKTISTVGDAVNYIQAHT